MIARILLAIFIFQFVIALPQTHTAARTYKRYKIFKQRMVNERMRGCFAGVKYNELRYKFGTMHFCSDYIKQHQDQIQKEVWDIFYIETD